MSKKNLVELEAPGVIVVYDNIKSSTHHILIKEIVGKEIKKGNKSITIKIPESLSITSAVIGVLIKFQSKDDVKIKIRVKDKRAYSILKSLNLIETLNVKLK